MSLLAKLKRLGQRDVVRHAGLLTGGTMLAQVITLAATPLLTRLYGPEQFGLLGLLMNIATMGGSVGALCYEFAILQPRSERMAKAVFALTLWLSGLGSLLAMLIVAGFEVWRPGVFGRRLDVWFYLFCFVGVLTTVHLNAFGYALSRKSLFRPVAVSKINQSLLPVTGQLGFGFLRNVDLGLMAGRTLGLIGTNLWLQRSLPVGYRVRDAVRADWRAVWTAAKRYKDYILHVPRQLLMRGATTAPPILLVAFFGPVAGGFFFFAQRIVERPGMMLGDALTRLPLKQFSDVAAKRRPLLRPTLLYSLVCGVPVMAGCVVLALIARPVVPVLFGREWTPAADYAIILGLWAAVRLSTLPMATVITVLRVQKASLVLDSVFFLRILAIPWAAMNDRSALWAVAAYCAISVIYHAAVFALGLWAVVRHDRGLKAATAG